MNKNLVTFLQIYSYHFKEQTANGTLKGIQCLFKSI